MRERQPTVLLAHSRDGRGGALSAKPGRHVPALALLRVLRANAIGPRRCTLGLSSGVVAGAQKALARLDARKPRAERGQALQQSPQTLIHVRMRARASGSAGCSAGPGKVSSR